MDEDTLNAAMRILNMAKVLESNGKLNRLMDMLGDCTEITWDNQYMGVSGVGISSATTPIRQWDAFPS